MKRALILVLGACAGDDATDHETCMATRLDGSGDERWVSELLAPGRPQTTTWLRDGIAQSRWTFAYDDGGRLIARDQDLAPLDGVPELVATFEHTATSTIETHDQRERVEYTLDDADRVTRWVTASGTTAYELAADGAVERSQTDAIDADTFMPFTRTETNRYEAGRLVEQTTTDSRLGAAVKTFTFTYDAQPGRLVVTRAPYGSGTARWIYTFDADGRPTRSEEDSDADGTSEWVVDIAYDGAAVTTRASRDGNLGSTYTFSAACGYQPVVGASPRSGVRPGTQWIVTTPGIPDAIR